MEPINVSLVSEALLLVQQQGLISSFVVESQDVVTVMLVGRDPIRQSLPSTIAFCRGLLEGVRLSKPVESGDIPPLVSQPLN